MFFLRFFSTVNKDLECGPLDDSLTNIQWLGKMSTCALEPDTSKQMTNKENENITSQILQVGCSLSLSIIIFSAQCDVTDVCVEDL